MNKEAKSAMKMRDYAVLLTEVKTRIRSAQVRATLGANAEMLAMYWDIGHMIDRRQKAEGWGAGVIPRLSRDIRNELPEVKGFSERNIKRMTQFFHEYPDLPAIGPRVVAQLEATSREGPQAVAQSVRSENSPQPVAKSGAGRAIMQQAVAQLPWAHHVVLMQKLKDLPTRYWYMAAAIEQGWSRDVLTAMIKSNAHERQGAAVTNFESRLPAPQSDLARDLLKDPYIFDFLTLEEPFREREMETGLVRHLEKFLLELGKGFSFVGRQYHLDVEKEDFYLDLLFYHLKLRCFIVIDLKKGPFKPEYAGKMNFYCSVVDDHLRHADDQPTIGLILCQDKKKIIAEYTLRKVATPIGVSEYELTRALPKEFKSALPAISRIEKELSE